jgi:uncharacterized protein (TIGR03118 family)
VSFSSGSPFWISDQATSVATLYSVNASTVVNKASLTVTIPTTASGPQGPTAQVFNTTSAFLLSNGKPTSFIFANLNGTISAWNGNPLTTAQVEATTSGAVYTGLAIGGNATAPLLYAANTGQNRVDVFTGSFAPRPSAAGSQIQPLVD